MGSQKISQFTKTNSELFHFVFYSFAFTYLLIMAFVVNAKTDVDIISTIYALTIPFYYYLIFVVATLLLIPVLCSRVMGKSLVILVLAPKFVVDAFLIADYFVFDIYRFHIDLIFINMLLHDFKGIGISAWLMVLSFLVYLGVFLVNLAIFKSVKKLPKVKIKSANFLMFVLFILGQFIHVVGFEYKTKNIIGYTPYLPYYAPLTSSSLMTKLRTNYPETFPQPSNDDSGKVGSILSAKNNQGLLQYPAKPMVCLADIKSSSTEVAKSVAKPNILLFVMESWRQDTMDGAVTPNIYQFSQQATQFNNHFSGGSVTVNGLFSLMYGLHPTYRDYMTATPFENQTLLTRTLEQQGYEIDVYTSSNLDRFSLKPMFFGGIEDEHYVNPLNNPVHINDKLAMEALLDDLQQPTDKPWFKFVFLSASHHSYQYPEKFNKFTPVQQNPEAFLFDRFMSGEGLMNDYKNSVLYLDDWFGQLWTLLEQTKQSSNTMAIVTSDHGEEFNDDNKGYWGHGSNFTKYQTKVPMIIKQPGQTQSQQINQLTGHIDVVPTLMKNTLNCQNEETDYSSGFDLFELPNSRAGLIMSSYKDKAYLIDGQIYATGLNIQSYSVDDISKENEQFNYQRLTKLKAQESSLLNR